LQYNVYYLSLYHLYPKHSISNYDLPFDGILSIYSVPPNAKGVEGG